MNYKTEIEKHCGRRGGGKADAATYQIKLIALNHLTDKIC